MTATGRPENFELEEAITVGLQDEITAPARNDKTGPFLSTRQAIDPFAARAYQRIPREILGKISEGDCQAILEAAASLRREEWANRHALDLRYSVKLFGKRWYLRIVGGNERRNRARLRDERYAGAGRIMVQTVLFLAACTAFVLTMLPVS